MGQLDFFTGVRYTFLIQGWGRDRDEADSVAGTAA